MASDIGSGTGISTRQLALALREWHVIGIEPGVDMLAQAVDDSHGTFVEFRLGSAEALPLESASAGLVIAAQSLQWFDRHRFYAEAQRVLAPSGLLGIMQNNRAWERSPFLEDYEGFLEMHSPAYSRRYRSFDIVGEMTEAGFRDVTVASVEWTRSMSHEAFVEMSRSSTKMKAAVEALGEAETIRLVEALLERHHPSGRFDIPYISELFVAQHTPETV